MVGDVSPLRLGSGRAAGILAAPLERGGTPRNAPRSPSWLVELVETCRAVAMSSPLVSTGSTSGRSFP